MRTLVFLDTCSLLDSCWDVRTKHGRQISVTNTAKASMFWAHELPRLSSAGSLIIPKSNYDELVKHEQNQDNADLAYRAREVLGMVERLVAADKLDVVGDPNDPFADAILLSAALKFRTQHHLIFVTQDRALARDLCAVRNFESIRPRRGQRLDVNRVKADGTLEAWHTDSTTPRPVMEVRTR